MAFITLSTSTFMYLLLLAPLLVSFPSSSASRLLLDEPANMNASPAQAEADVYSFPQPNHPRFPSFPDQNLLNPKPAYPALPYSGLPALPKLPQLPQLPPLPKLPPLPTFPFIQNFPNVPRIPFPGNFPPLPGSAKDSALSTKEEITSSP